MVLRIAEAGKNGSTSNKRGAAAAPTSCYCLANGLLRIAPAPAMFHVKRLLRHFLERSLNHLRCRRFQELAQQLTLLVAEQSHVEIALC